MSEPVNFVIEHYDNEELAEANEQLALIVVRLKAENDKLRQLADAVKEFVEDSHCEDCPHKRDCYDNNIIFCANTFSYHAFAAMRELGVEVE